MCVVKSLTTPTNTNNPQPHHSQIQHNFKAIKAQFTFAVIFFLAQAPVYGDRAGRLQGGMRVAHLDHILNFGLCLITGWVGIIGKSLKPS